MKRTLIIFLSLSIITCIFCGLFAKRQYLDLTGRLFYTADTQLLSKYSIVPENKLSKGGYITEREALEYIAALGGYDTDLNGRNMWYWYSYKETAPLDGISDSDKGLLIGLTAPESRFCVLFANELGGIDLDKNLTCCNALKYITRLTSETFGCTDLPDEWFYTEVSQTYDRAFERGYIAQSLPETANMPISRQNFYALAAKAAQTESCRGGYASYYCTLEQSLEKRTNDSKKMAEAEQTAEILEGDISFDNDLSLHFDIKNGDWGGYRWSSYFKIYTADNSETDFNNIKFGKNGGDITSLEMLSFLFELYPQKPQKAQTEYKLCQTNAYTGEISRLMKKYLDIKLPRIKFVKRGDAPQAASFTKGSHIIKLDGGSIKKGSICILRTYPSCAEGRKNAPCRCGVFIADKDADAQNPLRPNYIEGRFFVGSDVIITLSTAELAGNEKDGFTIYVSPESKPIHIN
ncbi:MAG: hypothetical protein IJR59_05885 [Firmicutes bacterium]|nr:hypothetical protein [Bacillota bacterium]